MIIDCHCHAGIGDGLTGPWDTEAHLPRYLARAARAGIDRTVVFATFASDYAVANRRIARIVRASRGRLYGFAFVHAARDAGRVSPLVEEAVERYGFRGIKAHRHDARISREICEAARRFGVPVLYDPMGEVGPVELVAGEYPDVPFIIPHLGSFADDWDAQVAMIGLLLRHDNVYVDTSAVRRFDLLAEAAHRRPRRVLFGSDGPWLHPGVELAKVRLLGLRHADERCVLGGNVLRLIARDTSTRRAARAGRSPSTALGRPAGPASRGCRGSRTGLGRSGTVPLSRARARDRSSAAEGAGSQGDRLSPGHARAIGALPRRPSSRATPLTPSGTDAERGAAAGQPTSNKMNGTTVRRPPSPT